MMDTLTVMFVSAVVVIAFLFNQMWLALVFGVVLIALLLSPEKEESPTSSPGPQIRPIIVKRKYVGPESIYPQKMSINITPPKPGIGAPGALGKFIGKTIKGISNLFSD